MQTSSKTIRNALGSCLNKNLEIISCNWLGGHASVLAMDWYGKERINHTPLTNMTINGKAVAAIQNVDNFTFARIYEAGHEVVGVFSNFLMCISDYFNSPLSSQRCHWRYSVK